MLAIEFWGCKACIELLDAVDATADDVGVVVVEPPTLPGAWLAEAAAAVVFPVVESDKLFWSWEPPVPSPLPPPPPIELPLIAPLIAWLILVLADGGINFDLFRI